MDVFSQNLERRETSTKKGRGVYSKVLLPAGQVILEFKGDIIQKKDIQNYGEVLQISEKNYLGLSGSLDDYINHSCDPNCGLRIVGSRALLVSLYDIKPDTEITFDYSTSSNDTKEEWTLDCACGSVKCRKKISGYQYLDKDLKSFYESKKIVPNYLIGK